MVAVNTGTSKMTGVAIFEKEKDAMDMAKKLDKELDGNLDVNVIGGTFYTEPMSDEDIRDTARLFLK